MALTWSNALAWRLGRQFLDPVGTASVADVVRRLTAVPAQFDDAAELAVRARRQNSRSGEVARALAAGTVIKTFSFRGATHLMAPQDAGAYLALRSASRMWELPSWQDYYRVAPEDWPALLDTVRAALADGPLTSAELGEAVVRTRKFRHLGFAFDDGGSNLLKPIAWHGAMSFGPSRDGRATFQRLEDNPRWAGIPDLEVAGPLAVEAYFRAYGPASLEQLHRWLGNGLSAGRRRIDGWLTDLRGRLREVMIGAERVLMHVDDLDDLHSASASRSVRLLPGYDQWVLGPGTSDPHIVPPARRGPISRKANLVLHGGVVSGTWSVREQALVVTWFAEAGRVPRTAIEQETARLGAIVGDGTQLAIERD